MSLFASAGIAAGVAAGIYGLKRLADHVQDRAKAQDYQPSPVPVVYTPSGNIKGIDQNPPVPTDVAVSMKMIPLTIDGVDYLVSSEYLAPIGIGEAVNYAKANGLILPTPRMVDAIWQAADLKLEPHPQAHDGTAKTMNSVALAEKQAQYIHQQIGGRPYNLLGGTHKDVVFIPTAFGKTINKPGIYGWHRSATDKIQQEMWGHSLDWKDYSQGLRLVKRV